MTNLFGLYLADNEISDISPLAGMTIRLHLFLADNRIADLTALIELTDSGSPFFWVSVNGNPLSITAYNDQIPALEARGADIDYDEWARPDDHGNSFAEATSVQLAEDGSVSHAGMIEAPGDVDMFQIVAEVSGSMIVSQTAIQGSLLDTYLHVYDCQGNQLGTNDDGGPGLNSQMVLDVTAGETYYVKAAAHGTSTGHYVLECTFGPPPEVVPESFSIIIEDIPSGDPFSIFPLPGETTQQSSAVSRERPREVVPKSSSGVRSVDAMPVYAILDIFQGPNSKTHANTASPSTSSKAQAYNEMGNHNPRTPDDTPPQLAVVPVRSASSDDPFSHTALDRPLRFDSALGALDSETIRFWEFDLETSVLDMVFDTDNIWKCPLR